MNSRKSLNIKELLDSDDELPENYIEETDYTPSYTSNSRFETIDFPWISLKDNISEGNHNDNKAKNKLEKTLTYSAILEQNKTKKGLKEDQFPNKGVLEQQDLKCKKSIVNNTNNAISGNDNKAKNTLEKTLTYSAILEQNKTKKGLKEDQFPNKGVLEQQDLQCKKSIVNNTNYAISENNDTKKGLKENQFPIKENLEQQDFKCKKSIVNNAILEKNDIKNGFKENQLPITGVLKQQDLICLKSIVNSTNNTTFLWLLNFFMYKDWLSNYSFLKSCLVSKLDFNDHNENISFNSNQKDEKQFKIIIKGFKEDQFPNKGVLEQQDLKCKKSIVNNTNYAISENNDTKKGLKENQFPIKEVLEQQDFKCKKSIVNNAILEKNDIKNGFKENQLPITGVLKQQDLICLKSIVNSTNNTTFLWLLNFFMYKDWLSNYSFLKSCLVSKLDFNDHNENISFNSNQKDEKQFKIIIKSR